jgi:replicative DNA helicase
MNIAPLASPSELAIAGLCVLHGAQAIDRMGDRLDTALFQSDHCRRVVDYVGDQCDRGKFVDLSTLEGTPVIEDVMAVMVESKATGASLAHIDWHLSEVEKCAKRKRLNDVATTIKDRILQEDVDDLEEQVHAALAEGLIDTGCTETAKAACLQAMAEIENRFTSSRSMGMSLGLASLDSRTQGAQEKQFWVLAGRPGKGKSMLAGAMARNAVVLGGAKAHICSLEMTKAEWVNRLIQWYAMRNINEVLASKSQEDLILLNQAAGEVAKLPITISDRGNLTRSALMRQIKSQASQGANFFVIDHLGLLDLPRKEYQAELGKVSAQLKALAKKLNIFILALVQLNRPAELAMMRGEEPSLMHLADSDGPGRDADTVLMLDLNKDLHIPKNRNGPEGVKIPLDMNGRFMAVSEMLEGENA